MTVQSYEIDQEVFTSLQPGINHLEDWKGKASGIAEYVANWGLERFWAMSRSCVLKGGVKPLPDSEDLRSYFSWAVARNVLCKIAGNNLGINADMTTQQFQERLGQLDFHKQVLMTELLIEIAETIQFWTMRIDDAQDNGNVV